MSDWVTLARIARPRGLKGEVIADAGDWTPRQLLELRGLSLQPEGRSVELEAAWSQRDRVVLKFRGIDTVEQAEGCRNALLSVPRADRPPPAAGEFFFSDLRGCSVIDEGTREELGVVSDCLEYGGPLLLEVKCGERELLIPFVNAICKQVDIANKRIVVQLPEGLREL